MARRFCKLELIGLLSALVLAAASEWAHAQAIATPQVPSAPDPQIKLAKLFFSSTPGMYSAVSVNPQDGAAPNQAQPTDDPVLTMVPHPEGGRWWVSGQANIIFQGRLPFHSPYEGVKLIQF